MAAVASTACSDSTSAAAAIAGTYVLDRYDGQALPTKFTTVGNLDFYMLSMTVELSPAGSYIVTERDSIVPVGVAAGRDPVVNTSARAPQPFHVTGATITLENFPGTASGAIDGGELRLSRTPNALHFVRR